MGAQSRTIGREAELALFEALLRQPPPWVCAIEAGAGVGKSTVWRSILQAARGSGWQVLATRPTAPEVDLALSGLMELLDPVPDAALGRLPAPQGTALRRLLGREAGPVEAGSLLVVAVRGLLADLTSATPVLLAVDDEHWLDGATAAVVAAALTAAAPVAVSVVVSRRDERPSALVKSLADAVPATRVELPPLGLGPSLELVYDRYGPGWSRLLVQRIWEQAGGNPLAVLELARLTEARRNDPVPEALPLGTLGSALGTHVEGLATPARNAAVAAAMLARPTLSMVEQVATAAGVEADVDAAVDGGVLVRAGALSLDFAHPLFRDAALGLAGPVLHRQLHRAAADAVTRADERAGHLAALADGPDESLAAEIEAALGDHAGRGSAELAVPLAEHALALTPEDRSGPRFRRRTVLADLLLHFGDHTRAREEVERLLRSARPGRERAEALYRVSLVEEGSPEGRWFEPLGEALVELGWLDTDTPGPVAPGDENLATSIVRAFTTEVGINGGQLRRARDIVSRWRAQVWNRCDATMRYQLILTEAMLEVCLDPATGTALLDAAAPLQSGTYHDVYDWSDLWRALQRMWHGHLDEAEAGLAACAVRAKEFGQIWSQSAVSFHQAELCWRRGRWREAERRILDLHQVWVEDDMTGLAAGYVAALVAGSLGDTDRALALARQWGSRAAELGDAMWTLQNRWAEGHALLAAGDPAAADVLAAVSASLPELEEVGMSAFDPDAVEALVRVGRVDEAEPYLARLETAAREVPGHRWAQASADRSRGILLAAAGEAEGAEAALRASVTRSRAIGAPYELARALLLHGGTLRRLRRRNESAAALAAALDLFTSLGARTWAARTRSELATVGGPRSPSQLTPTEARITALVAEGRSNAEISQELLVSVKAVEANLTRVYAKLGIRSRTQLVRRASESSEDA